MCCMGVRECYAHWVGFCVMDVLVAVSAVDNSDVVVRSEALKPVDARSTRSQSSVRRPCSPLADVRRRWGRCRRPREDRACLQVRCHSSPVKRHSSTGPNPRLNFLSFVRHRRRRIDLPQSVSLTRHRLRGHCLGSLSPDRCRRWLSLPRLRSARNGIFVVAVCCNIDDLTLAVLWTLNRLVVSPTY